MKNRGKRIGFVLIISLILLVLMVSLVSISAKSNYRSKASSEVLNKFDSGEKKVKVVVKLKDNRLKEKGFKRVGLEKEDIKEKNVYKDYILKEVSFRELKDLEQNNNIEKISKSHDIHAFLEQSNPIINASLTKSLQVSGINLTGKDYTVCVIDTGTNFSHPALIGKNQSCVVDCFDKVCVEDCSVSDNNWHGTHTAGIVGASGQIMGIASNVSLIAVKILDSSGSGSGNTLDVSRAIDWCVDKNVTAISMSFGTVATYSSHCEDLMSPWTESINAAYAANISLIAATGNDANTSGIASPSCIYNVTPVGDTYDANLGGIAWSACSDSTTAVDQIVCHANRNSLVQLFAPGALINSTTLVGYTTQGGTSMATPMVAGAFAIMRQFLNLTGQSKTPLEIEDTLNLTGKRLTDSVSGLNFSRIDIYSAVLSLDNINPESSLTFPENNHINLTRNQSFYCNGSDWQLNNVTFYLWNSSGLVNNQTQKNLGSSNSSIFNMTNLDYNTYEWNCLFNDSQLNSAFASSNFTLIIGGASTTLQSPSNQITTNQNETNFTCQSLSESNYDLANVSFNLWNSSGLVYNKTESILGNDNSTVFNYNFSLENNYSWNCLTFNNVSNSSWADSNYTIIYDVTNPNITLISPGDSASYTSSSKSITFNYNVTDNFDVANCSLVIGSSISLTNTSITKSSVQNFTQTFTPGTYNWNVNCTDNAGNDINSSRKSFTVNAPATSSSSGGVGGGGGGASYKTYTITNKQSSGGYTKELNKKDRVKFTFFDKDAEKHSLIVNSIQDNSVNITIQSDPINLILGVGQSIKLNFTSKDYYDLYIKLNSIENSKANLTIQTIRELIPREDPKKEEGRFIEAKSEESEKGEKVEGDIDILNFELRKIKIILYSLVIIFIIVIVVLFLRGLHDKKEPNKKTSIKKEYKEKLYKKIGFDKKQIKKKKKTNKK